MHLTGISLSLALLSLIAGGRSDPQCAFSIPALLKSGEMVKGCLEVKRHSQPVNVDIVLEVNGVNHTILNEQFPVGDVFTCPEFQVPDMPNPAPVFLTINAVAANFNYSARRAVVVAPTGRVTLIQLEKSTYKPGETVKFNVISLTNRLKLVDQDHLPNIYVTDPSGNRLYQWTNQTAEISILTLSFELLEDPEFGDYTINIVRGSRKTVTQSFRVEEYVLPNIKVEISAPKSITILDQTMQYKVNAKYTYGPGVPGKVSGRVCRAPVNYYYGNACNRNPDGLCVAITGELDSDGTFSGELDLTPFQRDRSGYNMALGMEIIVIEEGSGIQTKETKSVSITNQLGAVRFIPQNMESFFKIGLPLYVEAAAEDGGGNPLIGQIIELQVNGILVKNLTTDANGKVRDYIDTSNLDQSVINIQVIYKNSERCYDANYIVPTYSNDYISVTRFYSRSESFVQIEGPKEELQCEKSYDLTVKYIFGQSGLEEGETSANFSYMVMSRANIIHSGRVLVDLTNSLQGEFKITLDVTADYAPAIDVVAYHMLKEEVVLHKINLKTENCFHTEASSQFSADKAAPGSPINLDISSASRSMCLVKVYDSSLLLVSQDQSLTPEMVYSSLQYNSLNGYYYEGYSVAPPNPPCIDSNKPIKVDGLYYTPVGFPNEGDTSQQLNDIGLLILTNTTLNKPNVCGQPSYFGRPPFWDDGFMTTSNRPFASMAAGASADRGATTEIQSLRTSFPEVWFFDKVYISESGLGYLSLVVPGTITEWKAETLCFDRINGFGMSKYPANFTSFQEFFVSDFLPYSFVRGETLIVNVVISNYLNKCAKVRATLQPSSDYTVKALDEDSEKCICSGERASYSFSLEAITIGTVSVTITGETVNLRETCASADDQDGVSYKDTIVRSIIVQPEGIHKEVTKSSLVCVNDTTEVIPLSISLPENSVSDSISAKVTIIGDIVGRALVNPESLINDPTGCGEQNLATLAPIALVLDYLELTGRLTTETSSKGIQFIGNGYRRQLRYRNSDGSFSAFPQGQPSSWLTLKVLETLLRIKKYYPVEDRILQGALVYLENLKDRTTGGFKPQGTLFNNGLRGGAEDSVSFTAAVAAFLLQTEYSATPTLLREAMNYLSAESQKEQSIYNMALLLYVFRVAGNEERSNAMFNKLKEVQIEEEGTFHWERPNKPNKPKSYIFPARAASADIEISALVLLALTTGKSLLADLSYTSQVANWFARQQNAQGSYSTTADTVAVLQALCSYGALVQQKNFNTTVEVKHGDELVKEFTINNDNQLLLQTEDLPHIPGNYSLNVRGTGCVLTQTTVEFNIPVDVQDSAFLLSVYTPPESCVGGVAYTFPVHLNLSYNGLRNQSNMALISVSLPSGYKLEYQSLIQLRSVVPKVETINNDIIIYLNSVSRDIMSLSLTLEMTSRVQNYQPKSVLVWDYYEKEENAIGFVQHPCSIK